MATRPPKKAASRQPAPKRQAFKVAPEAFNSSNPAQLLLELLEAAAIEGKRTTKSKPGPSTREVLLAVFDVDVSETGGQALALARLGAMCELPSRVRSQVQQISNFRPEVALRQLGRFESALLNMPFERPWADFGPSADEAVIVALDTLSQAIDGQFGRSGMADATAEVILARILEISAVLETSPPDDLVTYIGERVDEIRQAVLMRKFRGTEPIQGAAARVLTEVGVDPTLRERLEEASIGKKFLGVVAGVALAAGAVGAVADADMKTIRVLPWSVDAEKSIGECVPTSASQRELGPGTDG